MMRTIQLLTLTFLTAGCFSAQSQVENNNFENWAFTDTTWDGQPIYTAHQWSGGQRTDDSYSGSFAAKVEPYMSCGMARNFMVYGTTGPFATFGDELPEFNGSGVAVNFKAASLSGYVQFLSPTADDVARGIVLLKKFNAATGMSEEVGRGEIEFTPTSDYVSFNIPIIDLQPGVMPDSMVIAFSSGMGFNWENENYAYGTLFIDELRIQAGSTAAGLEELTFDCNFYPNPSKDVLHVKFETVLKDNFTIELTDLSGRKVMEQDVIPGIESFISTHKLPVGSYIVSLRGNQKIYSQETIMKVD